MKKILPFFGCFLLVFALLPVKVSHAQSVNAELTANVATGATAAAGTYIISGLLNAAGGAYILKDHSDAILHEAQSIYSDLSDNAKDSLTRSIQYAHNAKTNTIAISDDLLTELSGLKDTVSKWVASQLYRQEAVDTTTLLSHGIKMTISADTQYWYGNLTLTNGANYPYDILIDGYRTTGISYDNNYNSDNHWYLDFYPVVGLTVDGHPVTGDLVRIVTGVGSNDLVNPDIKTVAGIQALMSALGHPISFVPSLNDTHVKTSTLATGYDQALQGFNEVDVPLDQWLDHATTADGTPLSFDDTTGAMSLPDGTTYDGEVAFPTAGVPASDIPDSLTLDSPTIGVRDAFPSIPYGQTGVDTGAGATTGEGLSVGDITGAITGALTDVFVPSETTIDGFDSISTDFKAKFNSPSDFAWLGNAIKDGGSCNVKDIYIDIFGQHLKIVDMSKVIQWSHWWKPIISGMFWFLFGWWLYRRILQVLAKNGGASW